MRALAPAFINGIDSGERRWDRVEIGAVAKASAGVVIALSSKRSW
jgi:hypothetical protein